MTVNAATSTAKTDPETSTESDLDPRDLAARHADYANRGWCRFDADPCLHAWIQASLPAIRAAIAAPENAHDLRYGGTWFAGVHALPNDETGAVPGGPPLAGMAVDFALDTLGWRGIPWDRAQLSVCYPGYPRPSPEESEALFRFRRDRDAAHIDGLLREGPKRRRFLKEYHAFVLAIPVSDHDPTAAPFTIWEGSHRHVGAWLRDTFASRPVETWERIELTEAYQALRRDLFDRCRRVEIHARPGEAYLVHRHALHGVAPWAPGAQAGPDGRAIVYFRPPTPDMRRWLAEDAG